MRQQPYLESVTIEQIHNIIKVSEIVGSWAQKSPNHKFWLDFSKKLPITLSNEHAEGELPPFYFFAYNTSIQTHIKVTKHEPLRWIDYSGEPIPADDRDLIEYQAALAWKATLTEEQLRHIDRLTRAAMPVG